MIILFCAFFNRKPHNFCEYSKKTDKCFAKSTKYDLCFLLFLINHTAQFNFGQLPEFARKQAVIELQTAY